MFSLCPDESNCRGSLFRTILRNELLVTCRLHFFAVSVRYALLGLLAQRPRHGYDLHAAFEAIVGGEQNWDVKPAQVYTTLSRLEQGGLIKQDALLQEAGPEKRVYAITDEGLAELSQWFGTGVSPEHQRDEFFIKLSLALALSRGRAANVIHTQRAQLYKDLHAITVQRQRADPKCDLARILLLDKAAMHLEADLRWLDLLETRLDEVQRQPRPEPAVRPRGRPKKDTGSAPDQTSARPAPPEPAKGERR